MFLLFLLFPLFLSFLSFLSRSGGLRGEQPGDTYLVGNAL